MSLGKIIFLLATCSFLVIIFLVPANAECSFEGTRKPSGVWFDETAPVGLICPASKDGTVEVFLRTVRENHNRYTLKFQRGAPSVITLFARSPESASWSEVLTGDIPRKEILSPPSLRASYSKEHSEIAIDKLLKIVLAAKSVGCDGTKEERTRFWSILKENAKAMAC